MILAEGAARSAAGPLGLLVILLMGVAIVLLIRNMNGRLKRLPREFPDQRRQGPPSETSDAPPEP